MGTGSASEARAPCRCSGLDLCKFFVDDIRPEGRAAIEAGRRESGNCAPVTDLRPQVAARWRGRQCRNGILRDRTLANIPPLRRVNRLLLSQFPKLCEFGALSRGG